MILIGWNPEDTIIHISLKLAFMRMSSTSRKANILWRLSEIAGWTLHYKMI